MKPQPSVSLRDRATVALRSRDPRGDWAPDWLRSCESLTQLCGTLILKLTVRFYSRLLSAECAECAECAAGALGTLSTQQSIHRYTSLSRGEPGGDRGRRYVAKDAGESNDKDDGEVAGG